MALLSQFFFWINSNSVAVAHYLDLNHDSDNDHVPDWYEVRHLGSLENNQSYDLMETGFPCFRSIVLTLVPPSLIKPDRAGFPSPLPDYFRKSRWGKEAYIIE